MRESLTDRILYPAIAFYFSAAFFFTGQSGMLTLPAWFSVILAITCFAAGLYCLVILWLKRGGKGQQDKTIGGDIRNGAHTRFNVRVDSKDFVDMDTEQAKNFFDGLQRITGRESLIQEKQDGRTKKKETKTTKHHSKTKDGARNGQNVRGVKG